MKKIRKVKNAIGLVGKIVDDTTSQKEDEVLNVKSIIDYVNNRLLLDKGNGFSNDIDHQDLNTITKNGLYYGNEVVNPPTASEKYGYLLVIGHFKLSTYGIQVFFPSSTTPTHFYYRQQFGTYGWSDWIKIPGVAV